MKEMASIKFGQFNQLRCSPTSDLVNNDQITVSANMIRKADYA